MELDPHYPTVSYDFLINEVNNTGKVQGIQKVGATTGIVANGTQAMFKRTTLIREIEPDEVYLEQAIALGLKFNFLPAVLDWLVEHRNWKDGAYVEQ